MTLMKRWTLKTMMITSVQLAAALEKVCGMVQPAERAKELVGIQNNTGIVTMTNWPFPNFPPVPWTAKQIKEYAQQKRAQMPESPL